MVNKCLLQCFSFKLFFFQYFQKLKQNVFELEGPIMVGISINTSTFGYFYRRVYEHSLQHNRRCPLDRNQ